MSTSANLFTPSTQNINRITIQQNTAVSNIPRRGICIPNGMLIRPSFNILQSLLPGCPYFTHGLPPHVVPLDPDITTTINNLRITGCPFFTPGQIINVLPAGCPFSPLNINPMRPPINSICPSNLPGPQLISSKIYSFGIPMSIPHEIPMNNTPRPICAPGMSIRCITSTSKLSWAAKPFQPEANRVHPVPEDFVDLPATNQPIGRPIRSQRPIILNPPDNAYQQMDSALKPQISHDQIHINNATDQLIILPEVHFTANALPLQYTDGYFPTAVLPVIPEIESDKLGRLSKDQVDEIKERYRYNQIAMSFNNFDTVLDNMYRIINVFNFP